MILSLKNRYPQQVEIKLPISKSMHIRAMMIEAESGRMCSDMEKPHSADTVLMHTLLREIRNSNPTEPLLLDAHNAGTVMRFLTAHLTMLDSREFILTGSERMKERPIAPLVRALNTLGADIEYLEKEGFPPLKIKGKKLTGGGVNIDASMSSQYITALMLIAPSLEKGIEIKWENTPTSFKYIELTAEMLQRCGVNVEWIGAIENTEKCVGVRVRKGEWIEQDLICEADWSSATFWYAAASILKSVIFKIPQLLESSYQPDVETQEIFKHLGVQTEFVDGCAIIEWEKGEIAEHIDLDMRHTPDIVPALVAACCANNIKFTLRGINSLRAKECDRVQALAKELSKLGFEIRDSIEKNTISWSGEKKTIVDIKEINTHDDHRMAMAMSLMTLKNGTLLINNINVVEKSYPYFWKDMAHFIITN